MFTEIANFLHVKSLELNFFHKHCFNLSVLPCFLFKLKQRLRKNYLPNTLDDDLNLFSVQNEINKSTPAANNNDLQFSLFVMTSPSRIRNHYKTVLIYTANPLNHIPIRKIVKSIHKNSLPKLDAGQSSPTLFLNYIPAGTPE